MRQDWKSYEDAAERGPGALVWRVTIGIALLCAVLSGIGVVFGWFGEAATVAREQVGPRALLEKYEWFKDTSATLDKKRADIDVFTHRVEKLEKRYAESKSRTDDEALNQAETELAGVISSYNDLSARYNAQMAKVNWRFANRGDLPAGADVPLPREYKPYEKGK